MFSHQAQTGTMNFGIYIEYLMNEIVNAFDGLLIKHETILADYKIRLDL